MPTEQDYLNAKQDAEKAHMAPGVDRAAIGRAIAIGIGPRVTRDVIADNAEQCLRFYVERKIRPMEAIGNQDLWADPKMYGVPTDVIETGRIVSFQAGPGSSIGLDYHNLDSNVDPAVGGTLGAVVGIAIAGKEVEHYVLGSNHAMAVNGRAIGARVVFKPPNRFIDDPEQLHFRLYNGLTFTFLQEGPNTLDCALAKIEKVYLDRVKAEFPNHIVTSADGIDPEVDMQVTKVDESEATTGVIVSVNAQRRFDFSFGSFDFANLVLIEGDEDDGNRPFAKPGDSGALVAGLDENDNQYKAMAIIIGGSRRRLVNGRWKSYTLACSFNAAVAELEKVLAAGQVAAGKRTSEAIGNPPVGPPPEKPKIELVFKLPPAKVAASRTAGK